jgi:hypothetical protein
MRIRLPFLLLVLLLLLTAFASISFVAGLSRSAVLRQGPTLARESVPPAVARRLDLLERTMPGNEGMSPEGPGGYDEQRWDARAYPREDIPLEYLDNARSAAAAIRTRGVGSGKNVPGAWFLMGPTSAVYQSTPYRFSYVPSQYESSGRVTAIAIAPACSPGNCRLWVAAAGGGVWRTDDALAGSPQWKYLSAEFGANAIGSIRIDPNDPTGNTIWVGTGESHASSDSAAGVGLYKTTDGGDTWSSVIGGGYFAGRAIAAIAIHPANPNVLYVASARGVRGVASTGGGTSNVPGAMPYGLWKSIDGGATFTFLHNGTALGSTCYPIIGAACGVRGVNSVALDPFDPDIVYAGTYGRGVWRSNDAGATWVQIHAALTTASDMRPELAVAALADGKTRMYIGEGASGSPTSRLFRSDDVATGSPVFANLTSANPADPGFGSYDFCGGQCWYDNLVYTPPGYPDILYLGGSYQYNEPAGISNGRTVVLSTDAGVSFTDMTKDATGNLYPNGLHPDQHGLAVNPNNPFQFFSGSDGGVMRSTGTFDDVSDQCNWRGLSPTRLARCQQLLSRVPSRLEAMNRGLSTLQFYSVSVDPTNVNRVMGGTQDNGTFQTSASPTYWPQTFWGDGGQSGFDVALNGFRFHTFYYPSPDVNFQNGAIHDWNWTADRIYASEPTLFYPPVISDPVMSGWMWIGTQHVWRTKTHGRGGLSLKAFRAHCNEFSGDFAIYCGDWAPLGAAPYDRPDIPPIPWNWPPSPGTATRLTSSTWGDRAGGAVSRVARASDTHTLWASTSTGRLFISHNADAEPYSAVVFTRIDSLAANDPNRFISGIFVDPSNPDRAWVSYSGYSAATPTVPGHVFEVVYDPGTNTATWTAKDGTGATSIGDQPVNDVAFDAVTGDLYAATDFAVVRLAAGDTAWNLAATGMPNAEVSALTIVPGARKLFAATHGLGAWSLALK